MTVTNQSSQSVYPHLFYLNPDFSIIQLYPDRGQQERLEPGLSLACPRAASDYTFGVYLPGDQPGEERWVRSQDMLKLVVTAEASDLSMLQQKALAVPARNRGADLDDASTRSTSSLIALLDAATSGVATRHQRPVTDHRRAASHHRARIRHLHTTSRQSRRDRIGRWHRAGQTGRLCR